MKAIYAKQWNMETKKADGVLSVIANFKRVCFNVHFCIDKDEHWEKFDLEISITLLFFGVSFYLWRN